MDGVSSVIKYIYFFNVNRFTLSPYSFMERIFWLGMSFFCIRGALIGGVYHAFAMMSITLCFDILGIREMDRTSVYDVGICTLVVLLVDHIFLDKKKYNLPVFLGYSYKSMLCSTRTFLNNFPGTKHWVVIVDMSCLSNSYDYCYVFHVRGRIVVDLNPSVNIMSKREVIRKFYGFHRLGVTNINLVNQFRRSTLPVINNLSLKINSQTIIKEGCFTCQQYSHFVCLNLVWPTTSVDYVYGRLTYCIMAFGIVALMFVNFGNFLLGLYGMGGGSFVSSLDYENKYYRSLFLECMMPPYDLNLAYAIFMLFDFFTFHRPGLERNHRGSRLGTIVGILCFLVLTFMESIKFNGFLTISILAVDCICIWFILPFLTPEFVTKKYERQYAAFAEVRKGKYSGCHYNGDSNNTVVSRDSNFFGKRKKGKGNISKN